jgi:hypothetical protein
MTPNLPSHLVPNYLLLNDDETATSTEPSANSSVPSEVTKASSASRCSWVTSNSTRRSGSVVAHGDFVCLYVFVCVVGAWDSCGHGYVDVCRDMYVSTLVWVQ